MHFRLRDAVRPSSSVRQPGAIVSSVKFAQCGLNCTQVDGDANRRRPFQSRSSSGEYVRIADTLHAGNSPARYPAHQHYASCADPANCTLPATDGGATGAMSVSLAHRRAYAQAIPVGTRSVRHAGRQTPLSSNKICHCSPINTRLAGEIPASCSALYIAG